MTVSRRLILAAGGASLALVGAGSVFVGTRTPYKALSPWQAIEGSAHADPRLDAFRHAILAPNPHNRQPWLIRLVGKDEAVISCDLDRRLPETDPFDRQIVIGFGCFLELARIAAAERGYRIEMSAFPEGADAARLDQRPVAHLRFVADGATAKDPLQRFILLRRSVKQPFDTSRRVGSDILEVLSKEQRTGARINAGADEKFVGDMRDLTWQAWKVEIETPRTYMESVRLMRIGKAEIEASPDGISLSGAVIESLALAGQISREQVATPGTAAYKSGIDRYRTMLASGMAYAWVVTPGNARSDQLAAGTSYVRMNLAATALGLAVHPVSQALQEFPEMAAIRGQVNARLGITGSNRLQMLARLGHGPQVPRTPRWQLEQRLVKV